MGFRIWDQALGDPLDCGTSSGDCSILLHLLLPLEKKKKKKVQKRWVNDQGRNFFHNLKNRKGGLTISSSNWTVYMFTG